MILQSAFQNDRDKVYASQEEIKAVDERYAQGLTTEIEQPEAGFFDGIGEAWKGLPAGGLKSMSLLEEVAANTGLSHINPDRIEQEGGYVIEDAEKHQEIVRNRLESDAKAHREEANGRFGIEPETVGMAGQVLYGLAETLPKAITASVVAGPAGGAALFGADYGGSQYLELRDKGVDQKTAAMAGLVSGVAGGVGVFLPATFGTSRIASATIGAVANMGLTGAELGTVGWILDRQNYDALAEQYGFNMTSVITSGIFGGVFGGAMWRPRGRAQTEAVQRFDDVQRKTVNQSIYEQLKAVGGKYDDDVVAHTQADLHANAIENLSRVYDVPFESVESVLPRIVRDDGALNESAFNQIIGERGAYGIVGAEGLRRIQNGEPVPVNNIVDMLSTAKEMHSSGLDARAIRVATGWERGADGYWKYEIPDGKWKIEKLPEAGEFKLGDVFDAPELYDAYPELRDIDVSFERDWGADYSGYFDPSDDRIVVNTYDFLAKEANDRYQKAVNKLAIAKNGYSETYKRNSELLGLRLESVEELESVVANLEKVYQEAMAELPEKRLMTVLHEIQHYIQRREGFESGASAEYFDSLKYQFDYKNSVIAAYQEFKERLDAGENIEKIRGEVVAELKDLGVDSFAANEGYYRALDGEGVEDVIAEVAKFPEAVRNGMDSYVAYRKVGGEVESRNTEIRHKLTEEERRHKLLADTEDVARDQQIFLRTNLFTTSLKTADFVPDADLIARAKDNFGVTRDPKEAFYVLPDGSMLDGSGRHWGGSEVDVRGQRQVDHGDVGEVMDSSGAQAMYDFMSQTGAMRFDANAGIASIARTPTPEQLAVLSRTSRGKYLALSRNTPEGRIVDDVELERASASDIRKFFDKAEGLYRQGVQGAYAQKILNQQPYEKSLEEDAKAWVEEVDKHESNRTAWKNALKSKTDLPFLRQLPLVFVVAGAKPRSIPLRISSHVFDGTHPEITPEILKGLPEALANPIAIFKSATRTDVESYVVMVELHDAKNATIVVPVEINAMGAQKRVLNIAKTVFPKSRVADGEPVNEWFAEQSRKGNLLYADRKKLDLWRSFAGSTSHWDLSKGLNGSVPSETDLSQLRAKLGNRYYQNQGVHGSYNPATREIKLTPNANLSTFSHEMGHWYLDTMMGLSGRGSALLDADIATLLREFGVNSVENWNALGVEGQRKYHEQFASWLEVYLSKGEAPNPSLKDVLARVAQWIVDVYESFGGTQKAVEGRFESEFGTKLPEMSDEVKAVMDRLFSEQKANRKMAAKKPTTEQVAAGRVVLQSSAATARIQKLLKKDRNKLTAKDARDLQDALRASDIAAQQMANGQAVDVADVVGDAEIDESMMKETRGNFAREFLMGGDDSQAVVLQNRDRDTVASVAQMNRIAAKPDYYLASFSRSLQDGAPIVSFGSMPDNAHLGVGDIVVGPNGRRIPVQYAVVEADSVLTSNDYLGNANPDYGNPSMVNAVAGNGRATGIREGYNRGTAEQYKADMIADTRHGVDAEVIQAMKKPLLVRFIGKDEVTSKLIEESNKQSTLARSPVEQAVDDAKLIARNVDKYQFDEDGLPTQETVQQFVADIQDPNALGRLLTPYGTVTPEAVTRVQNAVVQAAYGDMPFTQLFAMETKPGAKRLMNALVAAAPRFVEIRNSLGSAYDFSRQLLEGFKQVRESMLAGQDSVIQSGSIFGDDSASAFIDILDRNRNSMAGVMRELDPIFEAIKASQNSAGSMFGDEVLDLPEILSRVRQAENEARLAEGKPLLMDIDAEEMRQGIKAAQEMIEAVEEMQTRALEAEQVQDTQAVDPVERSRQMLTQDADAVRVQELLEEMPEMLFDIEDENGQMVKMSIADIAALNEADLAKADTEAASMGEVFACVDLNRGIE